MRTNAEHLRPPPLIMVGGKRFHRLLEEFQLPAQRGGKDKKRQSEESRETGKEKKKKKKRKE